MTSRKYYEMELQKLNASLLEMGEMIRMAIGGAVTALLEFDHDKAREIIAYDEQIDRQNREIEQQCYTLLLSQQPVAGDLRMVSAALKMTTDMERIGDHAADISEIELMLENLENFTNFLTSNNIDSRSVNLRTGDVLDGLDCLFIVGLQKDLTEDESQSLLTYTQNGGNVFVVRDYTDPIEGVPNYLAFLRSYGIVPLAGVAVAGEEDTDTYYGEPLYIIPKVCQLDMTATLLSSGYDVLLMPAASAFEDPAEPDSSLTVATVLKTGPHGYLRSLTDGRNTLDKQEGDREGELSLALYAHRMHSNGNVSRMFALGNSTMLVDDYIYQSTFNEQFLTAVLKELVPSGEISLDIMASSAFRPSLTVGSQTMGVALLVALPLLILLAAAFFLLPRRQG